ncbi:hypothetical protein [Thalassoglobus sp.]|uniref:hypothetical protein n=1 Tax=Thalassoglobus sp. TaxID=2795869 RepID=UPI003AA895BC
MSVRPIAVCEKKSFLTASLEREFAADREITFRWFPYVDDLLSHLRLHPYEIAIVDFSQIDSQSLTQLANFSCQLQLMVTCPKGDFDFECLLREVGVTSVIPVGTNANQIAQTIKKMIARDK